jgi:hypothetical protein
MAQLVPFGLCEDAEECRISVRYPVAERETANEDCDASEDGIEEVKGSHRSDADEIEQRAFHAQVSERLMEALEDSICTMPLLRFVGHKLLA